MIGQTSYVAHSQNEESLPGRRCRVMIETMVHRTNGFVVVGPSFLVADQTADSASTSRRFVPEPTGGTARGIRGVVTALDDSDRHSSTPHTQLTRRPGIATIARPKPLIGSCGVPPSRADRLSCPASSSLSDRGPQRP
jgi:hypothetical protein